MPVQPGPHSKPKPPKPESRAQEVVALEKEVAKRVFVKDRDVVERWVSALRPHEETLMKELWDLLGL